jgi:hypothetical protein
LPIVARNNNAIWRNEIERTRVGLAAHDFELAAEALQARGIARAQRTAHIGIKRQHDREMVLASDLGRKRVGDELHALLVDRLQ